MKKKMKKGLTPWIIVFVVILAISYIFNTLNQKVNELTYSELMGSIEAGEVVEINITPKDNAKNYELTGKLSGYKEKETFYVAVPLSDEIIKLLFEKATEYEFELKTNSDPSGSSFLLILVNVLPILLLIGVAFFIITRQMNGANKSMDFGKSKAKLNKDKNKMSFKDVAGLEEEKEEVAELIDFLKTPKKYTKLGARIPKGIMLVGPPGTGKTLLARAVAGEASVPFYYISGSDFVELFVGVGASRVRDMFKKAKQNSPCLIFIDEIDAVGRQRGTGMGGGHDEREQTLNQLLTEMDGFGENEGIIVIAATNRPDVLDPALLRPGRFDRRVTVSLPDAKARKEILEVHARNKKLSSKVTFKYIARRTVGFSGADLENLLNEAALLAVRRSKKRIGISEIDEGMDRVLMGPAKKSKKYSQEEKYATAIHEAGHAVAGLKSNNKNTAVQKITIVPRGQAGGYTSYYEKEDRYFYSKEDIVSKIITLLSGRAAEKLILNQENTGVQNDFERATKLARSMVTEYGMSSLGLMQYEHQEEKVFLGRDYGKTKNFSDQVALEIDQEVRKIIKESYQESLDTLKKNKDLLLLLADSLMEHEVLTKEQIDYLVENGKMPIEEDLDEMSAVELKELAKTYEIENYQKLKKAELIEILKEY